MHTFLEKEKKKEQAQKPPSDTPNSWRKNEPIVSLHESQRNLTLEKKNRDKSLAASFHGRLVGGREEQNKT